MQPRSRPIPVGLRAFRLNGIQPHHYSYSAIPFADVAAFMKAADHIGDNTLFGNGMREDSIALYMKFIDEEYIKETLPAYERWKLTRSPEDFAEFVDGLFDTIWVTIGALIATGLPVRLVWEEGAFSNVSKIDWESGKLLKREDGKVLKPEGWQPPNFLGIVEAAGGKTST